MKKVMLLVLMLSLSLSGALCYAHGAAGTKIGKIGKEGTPIEVKETTAHTGLDKSGAIVPSIDGHTLTVLFTENLGQVDVEITTAAGATVQTFWVSTPDGLQTYVPNVGNYVITFTLANGDVYYGEFAVTD